MSIRTRLFAATSALVLALTAVQWWLHARQLEQTERALGSVATSVGRGLLMTDFHVLATGKAASTSTGDVDAQATPDPAEPGFAFVLVPDGDSGPDDPDAPRPIVDIDPPIETSDDDPTRRAMRWTSRMETVLEGESGNGTVVVETNGESESEVVVRRFELEVEADDVADERYLVVRTGDGAERRVPIPISPTVEVFRDTRRQGLGATAGVLAVGLIGAAFLSHRLGSPLRDLAVRAERLGSGELGLEVPVTAGGEIGELQRAFGGMSAQLAILEAEREQWRQREHLAQLGDVSRGLAHTVRNPLNTLGLVVEELAGEGRPDLVQTARAQIRRIDRWLRSFLALGAGDEAKMEVVDLGDVTRAVVLEAAQAGGDVRLEVADDGTCVLAVPAAVRSALANLVDNAVQASPAGESVHVVVRTDGDEGVVEVSDRGPGLPREVRDRMFAPHVTTRPEGSGMGLYLSQQLIVHLHRGSLVVVDRDGGGTVARARLPLAEGSRHAE